MQNIYFAIRREHFLLITRIRDSRHRLPQSPARQSNRERGKALVFLAPEIAL